MNARRTTRQMHKGAISAVAVCVLMLLAMGQAFSDTVTYAGSGSFSEDGYNFDLSAEAVFVLGDSTLTITLRNTSQDDVLIPSEVLTGLLFAIDVGTLTPVSAVLGEGATVLWPDPAGDAPATGYLVTAYGNDIGAEWAYIPGEGLSSAGLDDLFGPGDRFDTAHDLSPPASPDGLQYGILSEGDDHSTGNTPVTGGYALVEGPVVFTLTASDGFTLNSIYDVSFQYGTSLDQPNIPIPEPSSLALVALGLSLVACTGMRKGKHQD